VVVVVVVQWFAPKMEEGSEMWETQVSGSTYKEWSFGPKRGDAVTSWDCAWRGAYQTGAKTP